MDQLQTALGTLTGLAVLSAEACWRHLRAGDIGRVAVSVGSTPDIFPVNYAMFGDEIAIKTQPGTKLAAATLMRAVAFEIDGFDPVTRRGWSVVVKGRGREPALTEELLALDEIALDPWAEGRKTRWLLVTPVEVTGREIVSLGQS